MLTPIDKPKERKIASEIAKTCLNMPGDTVPFIGVAGIPAAGKSFLCDNLQKLLKEEHDIDALVVSMDGYHYYRSDLDKMDDPEHAHARRGAEFTFDADRFVKEVKLAKKFGVSSFPSFDHAKKDPEQGSIQFDGKKHEVVIIEGLYVLLDKSPWNDLQSKDVFEQTYFVDTSEEKTVSRLSNRMVNEMNLSQSEAEERINNNDLLNARFIKENTDFSKHGVVELMT